MSKSTNEPLKGAPEGEPDTTGGVTPLRVVVWILGAGFAIFLIITGIVGILTKAR